MPVSSRCSPTNGGGVGGSPGRFRSAATLPDGLRPLLVNQKATVLSGGVLLVSADDSPRFQLETPVIGTVAPGPSSSPPGAGRALVSGSTYQPVTGPVRVNVAAV